jgi:hypothetical protein
VESVPLVFVEFTKHWLNDLRDKSSHSGGWLAGRGTKIIPHPQRPNGRKGGELGQLALCRENHIAPSRKSFSLKTP